MPSRPITKLSRADLADLNAFLTIERLRSFTKAAVELGITASALSHSLRNLESRLGIRLLNRTSRTVSPTEAGASLARRLDIGFGEIGDALAELDAHRDRPVGRLRINCLSDGARLVLAKRLPRYLTSYPEMSLEIAVNDEMMDVVAAGFDAGVRFGGTIPEDYVAVRLGTRLRWVAAASPRYLSRAPRAAMPDDLKNHTCIQLRTGQHTIYRWDFEKDGQHRAVEVPGPLCVNETTLAIEMALADHGVVYCLEERIRTEIERGALQVVLPDWSPTEPPFCLYYPGHRHMPTGLRELIAVLRDDG